MTMTNSGKKLWIFIKKFFLEKNSKKNQKWILEVFFYNQSLEFCEKKQQQNPKQMKRLDETHFNLWISKTTTNNNNINDHHLMMTANNNQHTQRENIQQPKQNSDRTKNINDDDDGSK